MVQSLTLLQDVLAGTVPLENASVGMGELRLESNVNHDFRGIHVVLIVSLLTTRVTTPIFVKPVISVMDLGLALELTSVLRALIARLMHAILELVLVPPHFSPMILAVVQPLLYLEWHNQ